MPTSTDALEVTTKYWRPEVLRISSLSFYDDMEWKFDIQIAGQASKAHRLNWMSFDEGPEPLYAPRLRNLLEELKCLVWTLYFDRRRGKPLSSTTTQIIGLSLRGLVTWMTESGLTSLSQITSAKSWNYVQWFNDNHARARDGKKRERKVTFSTAGSALNALSYAAEQGDAMRERGFSPIPELPYDGHAANAVVTGFLKLSVPDSLEVIPDHVALPILLTATNWVLERAEDIIRLQDIWLSEIYLFPNDPVRREHAHAILRAFQFSTDPRTGEPWLTIDKLWTRVDEEGAARTITLGDMPRRLTSDLVAACSIALQGMTGVRASDLAGLKVQPINGSELPSCVTSELATDGLTEAFLLNGTEQKVSHDRHTWVLGGRLAETDDEPIPIKAIRVLERLLRPYRESSGRTDLFIKFSGARSMSAKAENVGYVTSAWLTNAQRAFVNNYTHIKLSKHTHGTRAEDALPFRAHQWRCTFANFVIRTNKRALGPLATHFNHTNALMTELGYIGNDPELLGMIDDARVELASLTFMKIIDGNEPFTGGLVHDLRSSFEELRTDMKDLGHVERVAHVRGLIVDHSLRLHFTDYGTCGIAVTPKKARCREEDSDNLSTFATPNFALRRPSLCAGCLNFVVSRDNLPYWKEREAVLTACKAQQGRGWRHARELALARQFIKILEAEDARHGQPA